MATDMEAVIARLASHVGEGGYLLTLADEFAPILAVLQAAKAYVDAVVEGVPQTEGDAAYERLVRAMKGETL